MSVRTDTDVFIAGAGASGLAAACTAASAGVRVTAADGNDRAGKKLSATGNGRCNFTNINCGPSDYNENAAGFVGRVFSRFSSRDTVEFFHRNGLLTREEQEGRCYPYSGQASAVTDMLVQKAGASGAVLRLGDAVAGCSRENGIFRIEFASGDVMTSRSLIIAAGGRAGLRFGSTGDGYGFAKSFGHTLAAPRPALAGCVSDDPRIADLKGRARARATLIEDGREKYVEYGEVQFTGTGISGICIMNLTRYMEAARPAPKKKKKARDAGRTGGTAPVHSYVIRLDFLPEYTEGQIVCLLERSMETVSMEEALSWLINRRIAAAVAASPSVSGQSGDAQRRNAARELKNFELAIRSTKGWNEAQVTRGGIRTEEIDPDTMGSRLVPGLFFCGETVDVDGPCGGYNLQWAWSSGYVGGRSAAEFVKCSE